MENLYAYAHHRFWLASYERLNLRSMKYKLIYSLDLDCVDFQRNVDDVFNNYSVKYNKKKHIDASVKERPQTLLVPSEEICKRVLCNKHI